MGNKEIRKAVLFLEFLHKVKDLGLNGYVQGGNRLVTHYEGRIERQRPRYADALPLAAGEFMRIAAVKLFSQPNFFH